MMNLIMMLKNLEHRNNDDITLLFKNENIQINESLLRQQNGLLGVLAVFLAAPRQVSQRPLASLAKLDSSAPMLSRTLADFLK